MEGSDLMPEAEEQVIRNREQTASQCRENGKLVIRPFDRVQRGAHRFHFLALMKRTRLPELMRDVSSLQGVHVSAAYIGAERDELPEEDRDMTGFDRDQPARPFGI